MSKQDGSTEFAPNGSVSDVDTSMKDQRNFEDEEYAVVSVKNIDEDLEGDKDGEMLLMKPEVEGGNTPNAEGKQNPLNLESHLNVDMKKVKEFADNSNSLYDADILLISLRHSLGDRKDMYILDSGYRRDPSKYIKEAINALSEKKISFFVMPVHIPKEHHIGHWMLIIINTEKITFLFDPKGECKVPPRKDKEWIKTHIPGCKKYKAIFASTILLFYIIRFSLKSSTDEVTTFQEVDTVTLAEGHILSSVSPQLDERSRCSVALKVAKEAARLTALNSCLPQLLDVRMNLDSSVPSFEFISEPRSCEFLCLGCFLWSREGRTKMGLRQFLIFRFL
ncbi:hypothetical protein PROFUN_16044 [Planoprotostelium fungivorum]|uniref:Uncharacterized protein n=1 Tax=Planoprotostelium fungivorum TaxID=1890364 RepID=A0A2P6MSS1_9EUKA|nr:hypothetical protein PROFUN_16044 [Planoprotostelium fungivorum]